MIANLLSSQSLTLVSILAPQTAPINVFISICKHVTMHYLKFDHMPLLKTRWHLLSNTNHTVDLPLWAHNTDLQPHGKKGQSVSCNETLSELHK